MNTILEMQDISVVYNETTTAIAGIDFTVKEGEFVAIIGASGAGKSTLLRCINLLIKPTTGSVNFLGENIVEKPSGSLRSVRANIGMIFQHYNLIYRASVLQNVLHGRLGHISPIKGLFSRYSQADKEFAIQLLENIGLSEQIYKRADELSGGQKQRVGICRALCQQPQLMLADEPIASLDPKSSADVMDALYNSCKKDNIACVANLHQVEVAKAYATRIVGIKKGKIVFDGTPAELTDAIIQDLYEGKENELFA